MFEIYIIFGLIFSAIFILLMYTFNIDPTKNTRLLESQYSYLFITLRGVFLALLIFGGSFLAPYIGCNFQDLLRTKSYTRYVLLFLIIYFSINLADPSNSSQDNPLWTVLKSVVVLSVFLFINAIDKILTLFALLIFTSSYFDYYKRKRPSIRNNKFANDMVFIIKFVISICIIGVLVLSVFMQEDMYSFLSLSRCTHCISKSK
jgi:hypothetical protein